MKTVVFERDKVGAAFAEAAIYAARNKSVKLYRANGQWIVEVY